MAEISIIMPAYNAENFIRQSIGSIMNQTFSKWELIVIDDGSTDSTGKIIKSLSLKDDRIKVIENKENYGSTRSRNRGINISAGRYIVLMDADDIAMPERLEKQVQVLDKKPHVAVVISNVIVINENNCITDFKTYPRNDKEIRKELFIKNTLCHSSAMLRKNILARLMYDEDFMYSSDYDLWLRIPRNCEINCVDEFLIAWRNSRQNISYSKEKSQLRYALKAKIKALLNGNMPLWSLFFLPRQLLTMVLPRGMREKLRNIKKNFLQKRVENKRYKCGDILSIEET